MPRMRVAGGGSGPPGERRSGREIRHQRTYVRKTTYFCSVPCKMELKSLRNKPTAGKESAHACKLKFTLSTLIWNGATEPRMRQISALLIPGCSLMASSDSVAVPRGRELLPAGRTRLAELKDSAADENIGHGMIANLPRLKTWL